MGWNVVGAELRQNLPFPQPHMIDQRLYFLGLRVIDRRLYFLGSSWGDPMWHIICCLPRCQDCHWSWAVSRRAIGWRQPVAGSRYRTASFQPFDYEYNRLCSKPCWGVIWSCFVRSCTFCLKSSLLLGDLVILEVVELVAACMHARTRVHACTHACMHCMHTFDTYSAFLWLEPWLLWLC